VSCAGDCAVSSSASRPADTDHSGTAWVQCAGDNVPTGCQHAGTTCDSLANHRRTCDHLHTHTHSPANHKRTCDHLQTHTQSGQSEANLRSSTHTHTHTQSGQSQANLRSSTHTHTQSLVILWGLWTTVKCLCWAAVQKQLNRSRCHLRGRLVGAKEKTYIKLGFRPTTGRGTSQGGMLAHSNLPVFSALYSSSCTPHLSGSYLFPCYRPLIPQSRVYRVFNAICLRFFLA